MLRNIVVEVIQLHVPEIYFSITYLVPWQASSGSYDNSRVLIRLIAQSIDTSAKSDAFVNAGFIPLLPLLLQAEDQVVKIWGSIAVRNLVLFLIERLTCSLFFFILLYFSSSFLVFLHPS